MLKSLLTRDVSWTALILSLVFILISFGSNIDRHLYDNDLLHNMGVGIGINGEHPLIQEFAREAEANCLVDRGLEQSDVDACVAYQNVVPQQVQFSHPIYSTVGYLLAQTDLNKNAEEFAQLVQRSIVLAGLVGNVLLITLLVIAGSFLSPYLRFVAGVVIALGVTSFFKRSYELWDFASDGISVFESVVILALMLAFVLSVTAYTPLLNRVQQLRHLPAVTRLERMADGFGQRDWLRFSLITIVVLYLLAGSNPVLGELAFISGLLLIVAALLRAKIPFALSVLFVIVILIATSALLNHPTASRHKAGLLLFICYLATFEKRSSALVFLMPISLVFHIASATVISMCIFVAEAFICAYRRRISAMLIVSLITSAAGYTLMTLLWTRGLHSPEMIAFGTLFSMIFTAPQFWVSVLLCASMMGLALFLMRQGDENTALARAFIMIAQVCFLVSIGGVLKNSGNPFFDLTPGFYAFSRAAEYFSPFVFAAALATVLALLLREGGFELKISDTSVFLPKVAAPLTALSLIAIALLGMTPNRPGIQLPVELANAVRLPVQRGLIGDLEPRVKHMVCRNSSG